MRALRATTDSTPWFAGLGRRRNRCSRLFTETLNLKKIIRQVSGYHALIHIARHAVRRMMNQILDNIVWHTLLGPHARYTIGTDEARRYERGFPPFVGFSDIDNPNFRALAPYVESGEHLYCDGWAGDAPVGWRIEAESTLCKMIWSAATPVADTTREAIQLGPQHASAALELTTLVPPGPFGSRTLELGDYFGVFEGTRLVAMAGGRLCAGKFREISGVCTHPDFQGRGLAKTLVLKLIRRQLQRNEIPFLRVMQENTRVHSFYQRMGFCDYRESVARVFSRV
jgi:GNAT superfamily N-acetyltransferase